MTAPRTWLDGGWFVTFCGIRIDPMNVTIDDIDLVDVAHHLAHICRFGGACPTYYSVASHSMYVADSLPAPLRVEGLLHDAAEAYTGDMIKCLKVLCPDFQALEERFELAVRRRFDLPPQMDPLVKAEIKRADIAALLAERRDIFLDAKQYDEIALPGKRACVPLSPEQGRAAFLRRAAELGVR